VTDARGVSVHRFDPAKAPADCRANPGPTIPDAKAFESAPVSRLRGGDALGCKARRIPGWLELVCHSKTAPQWISLQNAFATDYRSRHGDGPNYDVETNGLQERLMLVPAPEPFVELVVRFTRGTRVEGTIHWTQESRRFDLVWAAQEADPQWVGTVHPARAMDNAG
jgi:hypothetical protein